MYPIRTLAVYRRGERYTFDPDGTLGWEPVHLKLEPGTRAEWSGSGARLLYRGDIPFGVEIHAALQLGWCTIVEDGPQ